MNYYAYPEFNAIIRRKQSHYAQVLKERGGLLIQQMFYLAHVFVYRDLLLLARQDQLECGPRGIYSRRFLPRAG